MPFFGCLALSTAIGLRYCIPTKLWDFFTAGQRLLLLEACDRLGTADRTDASLAIPTGI
ncbi:MAG: hypothetical protein WCT27_03225 [Patescibacteria group bacterium]